MHAPVCVRLATSRPTRLKQKVYRTTVDDITPSHLMQHVDESKEHDATRSRHPSGGRRVLAATHNSNNARESAEEHKQHDDVDITPTRIRKRVLAWLNNSNKCTLVQNTSGKMVSVTATDVEKLYE